MKKFKFYIIRSSIFLLNCSLLLLMISCTSFSPIKSIEIINSSRLESMMTGLFTIDALDLLVTKRDGKTLIVPVTKDMISSNDLAKLDQGGQHTITIIYEDKKIKFSFEIYDDSASKLFNSFYEHLNFINGQVVSYEEWIKEIKDSILPNKFDISLFYFENNLYWRYDNDLFWSIVPLSHLFNFVINSTEIGVLVSDKFIPMFPVKSFLNDELEQIYDDFVEYNQFEGDLNSFLVMWINQNFDDDNTVKIEYKFDDSKSIFDFLQKGSYLSSFPIIDKLGFKHIGWFTSSNPHSSISIGSLQVNDNIVLIPQYEVVENGFAVDVFEETFTEKTIDIYVSGQVKLNGYSIVLEYDNDSVLINSIQNSIGNVINSENIGTIIFNYVNVQQSIDYETILLRITFNKINPYFSYQNLNVNEVILVNDYYQSVYTTFSVLNLY